MKLLYKNTFYYTIFLILLLFERNIGKENNEQLDEYLLIVQKYSSEMDELEKRNLERYVKLSIRRLETAYDKKVNLDVIHQLTDAQNCLYYLSKNYMKNFPKKEKDLYD